MRPIFLCLLFSVLLSPGAVFASGLHVESRYSALSAKRSPRPQTRYILLHTTEGAGKGSLEKLRRYGEAHYMVDTDGKVYRIIPRDKIAMHAGRSMWNGETNLDNRSIGIEVVGYHDKMPTEAQVRALRELLRQLKGIYRVPDDRVLPHSMVAYGRPNRWHPQPHRGRKRCGMLFADSALRLRLGLLAKPDYDPDVRAKRLINADAYLASMLFRKNAAGATAPRASATPEPEPSSDVISRSRSAWDIAREKYNNPGTVYVFPDGKQMRGDQISKWNALPVGTRVVLDSSMPERSNETESVQTIGRDGASAVEIAGKMVASEETIYFLRNGQVKQGNQLTAAELAALPSGTRMLVGYTHGGVLSAKRPAFAVCGPRWNLPSTFYRFPDGSIRPGNEIDEGNIPSRTMVFFQR